MCIRYDVRFRMSVLRYRMSTYDIVGYQESRRAAATAAGGPDRGTTVARLRLPIYRHGADTDSEITESSSTSSWVAASQWPGPGPAAASAANVT